LPPGRYVNIFNGAVYDGDRELWISRPLSGYPVFAREGSIVPLDAMEKPSNGGGNPEAFEVLITVGGDGKFEILEDDGSGNSVDWINWARMPIKCMQAKGIVEIGPITAATSRSETREWSLRFLAMTRPKLLRVSIDGIEQEHIAEEASNGLLLKLGATPKGCMIVVDLGEEPQLDLTNSASLILPFLSDAQLNFELKENIWQIVTAKVPKTIQISRLHALDMDSNLRDAVLEYVLADSRLEG
jgi:hypothetical protein